MHCALNAAALRQNANFHAGRRKAVSYLKGVCLRACSCLRSMLQGKQRPVLSQSRNRQHSSFSTDELDIYHDPGFGTEPTLVDSNPLAELATKTCSVPRAPPKTNIQPGLLMVQMALSLQPNLWEFSSACCQTSGNRNLPALAMRHSISTTTHGFFGAGSWCWFHRRVACSKRLEDARYEHG